VGGILVVGGRNGLLSAAIAGLFVVLVLRPRFAPIAAMVVFALASVSGAWWLRESQSPDVSANWLNSVTSGRITIYDAALSHFAERPIAGSGYGQVVVDIGLAEPRTIHNLYLRVLVEGGLAFLAALLLILGRLVRDVLVYVRALFRDRQSVSDTGVAYAGVLIAGAVGALFEGDVLLGAMHVTVIWWACAGLVARNSYRVRGENSGAQPQTRGENSRL
jgi:O-antigen ligase